MNIEDQNFETIHTRLLADIDNSLDKRQGSVAYDMTAPTAVELELAYAFMSTLLDRGFADTAAGADLDRRVAEQGLTRKPAIKATGSVVISGTDGFVVEAGTRVSTTHGVQFTTDEAVTIANGSATAPVTAFVGGSVGNVDANTITIIDSVLSGVTGVINPAVTSGGIDEESDAELLSRYLEKVSLPATSGNEYHYKQTAKEVPGVQDARAFPLWQGAGTVRVVITSSDGLTASPELVAGVTDHIENMRPIGADVTVSAANVLPVTVSANIQLDPAYHAEEVKAEITAKIHEYIGSLGLDAAYVRMSQIMRVIMTTDGVLNCSTLTLNGSAADAVLASDDAPVVAGVSIVAD